MAVALSGHRAQWACDGAVKYFSVQLSCYIPVLAIMRRGNYAASVGTIGNEKIVSGRYAA
jgi:hypothetical protein